MIVVRVELWSAVTGRRTELARLMIDNVGGTRTSGDYRVRTLRGRSEAALDQAMLHMRVQREGRVLRHPRLSQHVWHLVAKALVAVGYLSTSYDVMRIYARNGALTEAEEDAGG